MDLYLISAPVFFPGEHTVLSTILNKGEFVFHLRKPQASKTQLSAFLHALPQEFVTRTVIHQHHGLTEEFPLKGIHLNAAAKKNLSAGTIHLLESRKPLLTVSASIHELSEIPTIHPIFDYVFISPVFDSISKKGYHARIDLQEAKSAIKLLGLAESKLKIIALGGILPSHLHLLKESGFHGAAVLGAIWEAAHPKESMEEFQHVLHQL